MLYVNDPIPRHYDISAISGYTREHPDVGLYEFPELDRIIGCDDQSRRGFNILTMDPLDLGSHRGTNDRAGKRLFKRPDVGIDGNSYSAAAYAVPRDLILRQEHEIQIKENASFFFSESQVIESSGFSVNFEVGGGKKDENGNLVKGGSAKYGYSQTRTRMDMDSRREACRFKNKVAFEFWLIVNKERIRLSDDLASFLRKMEPEDKNAWRLLFEEYGTHYSLSTLYGGMFKEEAFMSANSVANSITDEVKHEGGISGAYKGVKGSSGFSVHSSKTSAFKAEVSDDKNFSVGRGLTGGSVEAADALEQKKYVPLKVDLRPIYDVFWSELVDAPRYDEDFEMRLAQLRKRGPEMLQWYKREHGRQVVKRDLTPRIYDVVVESVKLTMNSEGNGDAAEIYGDLTLKCAGNGAPGSRTCAKIGDNATGDGVLKGKEWKFGTDKLRPGNMVRWTILPTATPTGSTIDFDKCVIEVEANYAEDDIGGDDYFDKNTKRKFTLKDFGMAMTSPRPKSQSFKISGVNAGEMVIELSVNEINYRLPTLIALPDFPGAGAWRRSDEK